MRNWCSVFSDIQQLRLASLALLIAIVGGVALFGAFRLLRVKRRPLGRMERSVYLAAIAATNVAEGTRWWQRRLKQ
jgi:hypothetical protein